MKTSEEILRQKGVLPRLRLGQKVGNSIQPTGAQRVKLISDFVVEKPDPENGNKIEYMRYVVEHNGEKKYYDTRLYDTTGEVSYLVQNFRNIKEGEEVILEMKRNKMKLFVEITRLGETKRFEEVEEKTAKKQRLELLNKMTKNGKSLSIEDKKNIAEGIKVLRLNADEVFAKAMEDNIADYNEFFTWLKDNYAEAGERE